MAQPVQKYKLKLAKRFWTGIITPPQKKNVPLNHGWIIKSCSVPGGFDFWGAGTDR